MLEKYLRTLEYPKILTNLAHYALFSAGKELATALKPTSYFTEAAAQQAETAEARHLLSVKPDVGVGGARDARPLIEQARKAIILSPQDLLTISRTLTAARDLRRTITRLEERYPRLADIAYRLHESLGLVSQINQAIDDSGSVKDAASPALARIRRELTITHGRLQDKMRRLLASEKIGSYLQEGFITQRDGRYVLPLKAEFKGRLKGIIHDQSASGATLFVEPVGVVALNNRWKELQLEETQEINRILLALTGQVAEQGKFIAATVQALAELDLAFAKARYAEALQAAPPDLLNPDTLSPDAPRLALKQARHPLLTPDTVVPIDLTLPPGTGMLVITGPNTGGKTVSLKTAGLLCLMAQSGLQIPAADGSQTMVFDGIFADIGDEQSLEQSLSTFSAHMTNIVAILNHCTPNSLVIFDELGAGTDPIEGAALARAILNELLARRTTTLVATHYAELKAFAYTTGGVNNASTEFDLDTLSPTYKLQIGLPGNSNAFAIAERLGLAAPILQVARGLVGADARETEMMLAQIKADLDAARHERLRLEEERAEAEYYRQKTEARLADVDEEARQILKRARQKAQQEIDKTRATLRKLRREAKKAAALEPPSPAATAPTPVEALENVEAGLDNLQAAITPPDAPPDNGLLAARRPSLNVGDRVDVPHLNAAGIVTAVNPADVEVQLGRFRTTVKRADVNLVAPAEPQPAPSQAAGGGGLAANSPGLELDLRGQVSEDALHRL
ncbi:MAG: endonuclease MutS2, partial [Anaerolineae bacterium]